MFNGVKNAIITIGLLIGPFLIHKLKISELKLVLLSLLSQLASVIFLSFATNGWMIFFAGVISIFSNLYMPNIKTIIATLVEANEVGQIYAWLNLSINIALVMETFAASYVYKVTVDRYAGAAFLVIAGFVLIALILIAWVHFDQQRSAKNAVSQSKPIEIRMIYLGKF